MDFNTDYVRQQVSDSMLRDLLIKSRKKNEFKPVYYHGRKYWCLDDLTKEKEIEGRNKAIREMTVAMIIGMSFMIVIMYKVLPIFIV